jgi:glycosyltransferase involved in cell wall biosynthesis
LPATSPLVSVVVPTHNRADLIGGTLDSILNQTFTDFEVIVVDNGSTDGTDQVVASIADPRIRYHWQEDSGLPANSRNVGIGMARGAYIAFLDSDDLWLPEKLELQMRRFSEQPDAALVYGDAIYFGDTEKAGKPLVRGMVEGRVFRELLLFNRIGTLTVVVRKDCLDEVGVFSEDPELKGAEDYHLWLRLAHRYPFAAVGQVVARYRVHDSNLIGQTAGFDAIFKVLEKVANELGLAPQLVRRAYSLHYAGLAWSCYKSGDRPGYQAACKKALSYRFYPTLAFFRLFDLAFGPKLAMCVMKKAGFS